MSAFDFYSAPQRQPNMMIAGVQVSITADLLAEAVIKGDRHRGAAVFRMTQDNSETETAINKRREMGLYVSTLVRTHVDQGIDGDLPASNRLCMSIDIQHGEVFQAPQRNTNRQRNIESACEMIASYWPQITENS